jgi:high-affinity iron transporter
MGNLFTGMVLGFCEGLEAFLIVVILMRFLRRTSHEELVKNVWLGSGTGIAASLLVGGILFWISSLMGTMEQTTKLWESIFSFLALILIMTLIVWMIKHGTDMVKDVENHAAKNLSAGGILGITALMVAREGIEIAIFTFAGEYSLLSVFIGILAALLLTVLIYYSLVKVNLKTIFTITLFYLILQAGFLLGYRIQEGLSALKDLGIIAENSPLLLKAFSFSGTVLDHKTGVIGLSLYILAGWHSKPEILQFVMQYLYTALLFIYLYRINHKVNA